MIEQRNAESLAKGYLKSFRLIEALSVLAFFTLTSTILYNLGAHFGGHAWLLGTAALIGLVLADLVSGIVHWAGDTWGTPEWPLLGPTLIRPFREHHVDPLAMTRHDFLESSGTHCLISLPVLIALHFVELSTPQPELRLFFVAAMNSMVLFVFLTARIHVWAHLEKIPLPVRLLQHLHLILRPDHHAIHHQAPFAKYYCITNGWMNPVLYRTRFFLFAERAITFLTGALPRQDDIGILAAASLINAPLDSLPASLDESAAS
ncbi:MAG: fatty acid desaturase CarF family protein [Bdellovibrionota bacterium]